MCKPNPARFLLCAVAVVLAVVTGGAPARTVTVTSEDAVSSNWRRSRTIVASSLGSLTAQVEQAFGLPLVKGPSPFNGLSFLDSAGDLVAYGEAEWHSSIDTVIAHFHSPTAVDKSFEAPPQS